MKAVAFYEYGGPQVLKVVELPQPEMGEDEVLIRVAAAGVNPADWKWRQGMFASVMQLSFPYIPGYDIAGVVERGGNMAPGTRVMAMLDNLKGGAYAEYAIVKADNVVAIPDGMDYPAAAGLPCPSLTGVQVIDNNIEPAKGEIVVITGATGAVGRFALFAAKRRGALVVAAVREAHKQAALDLGADQAIALDQANLAVASDHLVDTVGGPLIAPWARKVKAGGKIRTVATDPIPTDGLPSEPEFSRVYADAGQLSEIVQDVAAGRIAPPPVRTLPLEQASLAHQMIEQGAGGVKIVLLTS